MPFQHVNYLALVLAAALATATVLALVYLHRRLFRQHVEVGGAESSLPGKGVPSRSARTEPIATPYRRWPRSDHLGVRRLTRGNVRTSGMYPLFPLPVWGTGRVTWACQLLP